MDVQISSNVRFKKKNKETSSENYPTTYHWLFLVITDTGMELQRISVNLDSVEKHCSTGKKLDSLAVVM